MFRGGRDRVLSNVDDLAIRPGVRAVVAEGAEEETAWPARDDSRGNGRGSGVGLDGERRREEMGRLNTVGTLDAISPTCVALVVAAPAPGFLWAPRSRSSTRSAA
jgi:hypothetical protein